MTAGASTEWAVAGDFERACAEGRGSICFGLEWIGVAQADNHLFNR